MAPTAALTDGIRRMTDLIPSHIGPCAHHWPARLGAAAYLSAHYSVIYILRVVFSMPTLLTLLLSLACCCVLCAICTAIVYVSRGWFIKTATSSGVPATPSLSVEQPTPSRTEVVTTSKTAAVKWPPGPLSNTQTDLSSAPYGSGIYTIAASSHAYGGEPYPFKAFDEKPDTFYCSQFANRYAMNTGTYIGGSFGAITLSDGSVTSGDYLKLTLPTSIHLVKYALRDGDVNRVPSRWVLVGLNASTLNWDRLSTVTKGDWAGSGSMVEFPISSGGTPAKYSAFAISMQAVGADKSTNYRNAAVIHELSFYGFEQA